MAVKPTSIPTIGFSKAKLTFDYSIEDAEQLLEHCEGMGDPLPHNADVFKRAGLVMALTAWETYVEDRVREGVAERIGQQDDHPARFMRSRLEEELKRFHNPNSEKTRELFRAYLAVDVAAAWKLQNFTPEEAAKRLDALTKKRGDAVHRAKVVSVERPNAHLVKKDELEKAIRFLKELVVATDRALAT